MSQPLISVVTVCFNSAKTIRHTLDAMLAQTWQNYEYWVIDGASTDGTVDLLKEYEPRFAGRMHWISEPDKGIYDAMNKGIARCKGDLVGIVNSDDWYEPDALAIMAEAWDGSDYVLLYGLMQTVTEEGLPIECHTNHHRILDDLPMTHPTIFLTRRCYTDFGFYDPQYKCAADYDMELRMRETGKVRFQPVYRLITNFRHGGMSSASTYVAVADAARVKLAHGIITKKQYDHTILYHRLRALIKD